MKKLLWLLIVILILFFLLCFTLPSAGFVYKANTLVKGVENVLSTDSKAVGQPSSTPVFKTISAYTSTPEQTDSSPCIGASGDICLLWQETTELLCATNDFSFGTRLIIGWHLWEGEKDYTCLVVDRMAKGTKDMIDLYFGFDQDCLDGYQSGDICYNFIKAKQFGIKILPVEIMNNK